MDLFSVVMLSFLVLILSLVILLKSMTEEQRELTDRKADEEVRASFNGFQRTLMNLGAISLVSFLLTGTYLVGSELIPFLIGLK